MAEYIEKEAVQEILKRYSVGTWRGIPCYPDEIKSVAKDVNALPAANGVVYPESFIRQIFYAVYALADMVNQFGYSTTFRKQDAVCDGGLSALEAAFAALYYCGCRVNSNGTISRKYLWAFMEECRRRADDEV